ncbi:MAG: hypothetical protein ABI811_24035 [Acidobacteriota bacterium]
MVSDPMTVERVLAEATAGLAHTAATGTLAVQMDQLIGQMQFLQTVSQAAGEATRSNTQAVVSSTSKGGISEGLGSVGKTLFGSLGMGLGPLISGVLQLFGGGGGGEGFAPLVKFELPEARNVNAGVGAAGSQGGAFAVDYGQGGAPRPVTGPQITVNVSAMDSQSFLDRRGDIALAVRQAMLESSVLSDVVREA